MKRQARLAALHVLLAALLLRSLVPAGWMPGSAHLGQTAWIICTADGSIQHGVPGKDDNQQQQQLCAFAAAHVLAGPQAQPFTAPLLWATAIENTAVPGSLRITGTFTPQSPRAPPISA